MIKDVQVNGLPYFPQLSGQKTSRVITKHFTNLAMYLPIDKFAMLTWLIYQSRADNTVIYSTQLLTRYSAAMKASWGLYNAKPCLNYNIKHLRAVFGQLVENGYLLPNYDRKLFTINPMLSYRAEYMRSAHYHKICKEYQSLTANTAEIRDFTAKYSKIVDSYMSKKKIAK
jgi:hypothetical protein